MKLLIIYILLNCVHWYSAELKCYECITSKINSTTEIKLCSQFDGSKKFEVSCPSSKFCMKWKFNSTSNGKPEQVILRGCASQNYSDGWNYNGIRSPLEEFYNNEGCFTFQWFLEEWPKEYCTCSANLCNSGKRTMETSFLQNTVILLAIFICNAIKSIHNIR